MKVLIGIDGSDGSSAAVNLVGRLLSQERDDVVLYYSPPQVDVKTAVPLDPQLLDRLQRQLQSGVFDKARCQLPTALQPRVRELVGTQKPAHGLLVAADDERAEMIVVGARGTGPLEQVTVGSIARAVAHHATIPVLVVRPRPAGSPSRLKVLFASDGSESSRQACNFLRRLSWPAETTGRIITVVESSLAGQIPPWLEEQLCRQEIAKIDLGHFEPTADEQQRTRDELSRWCGPLPAAFDRQAPIVAEGHAAQELLQAVESEAADLIVVGARGRGAIGRFLLGSTSEHLLHHARCSVLIVRQHEKA